jgi:hypothetical protein
MDENDKEGVATIGASNIDELRFAMCTRMGWPQCQVQFLSSRDRVGENFLTPPNLFSDFNSGALSNPHHSRVVEYRDSVRVANR